MTNKLVLGVFTIACIQACAGVKAPTALFSTWVVQKTLSTSNVQGLSDAEARALLGREIRYDPSEMRIGTQVVKGIRYDVRRLSSAQFFEEAYVSLTAVGIGTRDVYAVTVRRSDGAPVNALGATVYVASKSRLLLLRDGVFFEAVRKPGTPGHNARK